MNNIVKQEDKRGGRPYPAWLIQGFQKAIEDCGLHDIELEGYPIRGNVVIIKKDGSKSD